MRPSADSGPAPAVATGCRSRACRGGTLWSSVTLSPTEMDSPDRTNWIRQESTHIGSQVQMVGACRPRRNGSTPAGAERRERATASSATSLGAAVTPRTGYTRLPAGSRIRGDCSTCWSMSGGGAGTSTTPRSTAAPGAVWRWLVRQTLELPGRGSAPPPPDVPDRRRRLPRRPDASGLRRRVNAHSTVFVRTIGASMPVLPHPFDPPECTVTAQKYGTKARWRGSPDNFAAVNPIRNCSSSVRTPTSPPTRRPHVGQGSGTAPDLYGRRTTFAVPGGSDVATGTAKRRNRRRWFVSAGRRAYRSCERGRRRPCRRSSGSTRSSHWSRAAHSDRCRWGIRGLRW